MKLKVFKFYSGDLYYAYSGDSEKEAKETLLEEIGEINIDKIEEIPQSDWNKKFINTWEDNDFSKKPYKVTINDVAFSNESQLIFTNDESCF